MNDRRMGVGALSRAVGKVLGQPLIRSAQIGDTFNDLTEITLTIVATSEQMRAIGVALAEGDGKPTGPKCPLV
jgi:hypothetical protein